MQGPLDQGTLQRLIWRCLIETLEAVNDYMEDWPVAASDLALPN